MKRIIQNIAVLLVLQAVVFGLNAQQTVLQLDGSYQGKGIYVKNPYRNEKVGFCVSKVTVNGDVTTDEINSSSFLVDLSAFKFLIGDKVDIKIYHSKGCTPKVVNPEALLPKSTFIVEEINVDENQNLLWKTTGETGKLDFVIEQYKWGEWVKVGSVAGIGTPVVQSYKFNVNVHSGENKFRVYQKDYSGKKRLSKEVVYNSSQEKITFYPKKVRKDIVFSENTTYEVRDIYGNVVKKGLGASLDCSSLKKGFYYLNFDNETATFNKR